MKLWFDGQCFQTASRNRGIGRYCAELLLALKRQEPELDIHVSLNANLPVTALTAYNALKRVIGDANVHVWESLSKDGEAQSGYGDLRRVSELALIHHVNCLSPDVSLSSSPFEGQFDPAVPLLPSPLLEAPVSGIFYDAIPWRFPDRYLGDPSVHRYYKRRLECYRGFDSVLAISAFSKREAEDILKLSSCTNISAGVSPDLLAKMAEPMGNLRPDLGRGFIFYVGALDWRKNVEIIPKAIAGLPETLRHACSFVFAGDLSPPLLQNLRQLWSDLGLPPGNFKPLGLVSDDELVELYRRAGVVVQPSFMEGFGLTALEALVCDVPVLAARAGALPEIVQADEWLFDPSTPADLSARLAQVLKARDGGKATLNTLGAHTRALTWENTAATVLGVLHAMATKDSGRPAASLEARRHALASAANIPASLSRTAAAALALAEPIPQQGRRILIDATSTIHSQFHSGIQRVVRNICLNALTQSRPGELETRIIYCDDTAGCFDALGDLSQRPEKSPDRRVLPGRGDHVFALDSSWDFYRQQEPFFREAFLRGARITSCIYDTVPLRSSAFCARGMPEVFTSWLQMVLSYSTGLMCISKAVADEVISILEAMKFPRVIDVDYWPLGADFDGAPVEPPAAPSPGAKKSFLMVGTVEPRKGYAVALAAFEDLWARGIDVELVIAGKYGWGANDLADRIRTNPEYGRRLTWHQSASDALLKSLYADCEVLVAASFTEGFGLPVVEAGHFGKPVIASDIPVFREVAEGAPAAEFFPVGDAQALADCIAQLARGELPASWQSYDRPAGWPSWAESTQQLLHKLDSSQWYHRYVPDIIEGFVSNHDLDKHVLRRAIEPAERAHKLDIISAPAIVDDPHTIKLTVAVTNMSETVWPGAGIRGVNPVCLTYHVLDKDGGMLSFENLRTPVPMLLVPGDTQYMALYVAARWVDQGGRYIDVRLVQDGVAWWDGAVRLDLIW